MLFLFTLDAADCRHWLLDLARHITGEGHDIAFDVRPGPLRSRSSLALILKLEQRLYHLEGTAPLAPLDAAVLPHASAEPDMWIELSRAGAEGMSLFVGERAGVALIADALMTRSALPLSLRSCDGTCAAQGVPAISDPDSLWRGLTEVTCRIATLALMASDGKAAQRPVMPLPALSQPTGPARFFLEAFLRKGLAKLFPERFRQEHWRTGVRPRPAKPLTGEALDIGDFRWVPDDGKRYYADPVLVEHEGRSFLFLEEYPYASARGVIAYTEILPSGEAAFTPRVIIERQGHLSFPIIFRHEGMFYMIPENASEGHLPLYRARRFPDDWEEMAALVKAPLHDATLMEAEGRFWLIANMALHDGSSCDTMVAYSASSPLGPFEPHPANPLLIDARFTRGGGAVLAEAGPTVRFTQDCCAGYGRLLRFCRLDVRPSGALSLAEMGAWPTPPGLAGLHSYGRTERLETIDVLGVRHRMPGRSVRS